MERGEEREQGGGGCDVFLAFATPNASLAHTFARLLFHPIIRTFFHSFPPFISSSSLSLSLSRRKVSPDVDPSLG